MGVECPFVVLDVPRIAETVVQFPAGPVTNVVGWRFLLSSPRLAGFVLSEKARAVLFAASSKMAQN